MYPALTLVKHDIYADQPWAFSPLLATMYRIQANRLYGTDWDACNSAQQCFDLEDWPSFPKGKTADDYIHDDLSPLFYKLDDDKKPILDGNIEENEDVVQQLNEKNSPQAPRHRASWIGRAQNRKNLLLTNDDVLTFDFCNGFVRATYLR